MLVKIKSIRWLLFIVLLVSWLTFLGINEILYSHQLSHIRDHWSRYREKNLNDSLQHIQKRFAELEHNAFQLIEGITKDSSFVEDFSRYSGAKQQKILFSHLFSHNLSNDNIRRGIAVYNVKGTPVVWKDWVIDLNKEDIQKALTGAKFSKTTYSEEKVYTVLCCFVPIFSNNQKCIGTMVISTPLDTRYPLSSRHLKNQSFAEKMTAETSLFRTQIDFANDKPGLHQNSQLGTLKSLQDEHLGWVVVTSKPKDALLRLLNQQSKNRAKTATGCFIFIILLFILRQIFTSDYQLKKCIIATICIWGTRYIFSLLDFPSQLMPKVLSSPNSFSSSIFYLQNLGDWSSSLLELLLTSLAFFGTIVLWVKLFPDFLSDKHKHWLPLKGLAILGFPIIFSAGYNILLIINHSLIKDTLFPLFSSVELLPSLQTATLYIAILLFTITLVLIYVLLLKNFLNVFTISPLRGYILTAVIFIVPCYFFHRNVAISFISLLASIFALWLAALFFITDFPKSSSLRKLLLLGIICVAVYPLVQHEDKLKKHDLVMDYADSYEDQSRLPDVSLDAALISCQANPAVISAIEQRKKNAAFLLWANSYRDGLEELNNLHIFVYIKIHDPEKEKDKSRIFPISHNEYYYLLSEFNLNLPVKHWHQQLARKLSTDTMEIFDYVPGYGTTQEDYDTSFFVGGTPIYNDEDEQIGFAAIVTEYQRLAQTTPIPEYFRKPEQIKFRRPLLEAYFSGKQLIDTNSQDLPKTFSPPAEVIGKINQGGIWLTQEIDNRVYDCFYFSYVIKKRLGKIVDGKVQPILTSQDKIGLLGYPVDPAISLLFYFLQLFLTGIVILLIPVFIWQGVRHIINKDFFSHIWQLTFEQKLLLCFIIVSGVPVFLMGYLSKEKAIEQIRSNYTNTLNGYLQNAQNAIDEKFLLLPSQENLINSSIQENSLIPDDNFFYSWGRHNHLILNMYLNSQLQATNKPEFFQTELLPKRLPGKVYYNLMLLKRETFINIEALGNYTFIVGYKSIRAADDNNEIIGALSIPLIYQQEKVEHEVNDIISTIFTIYMLLFLVVFVVGIMLAHQITRPLRELIDGTERISSGELDVQIPARSHDEIGLLVKSFNRMTEDLKLSQDKLVKAERNAAWREMSRQIAHEIKNPLTPMKLNAQHILRAHKDQAQQFPVILERGIDTIIKSIDTLSKTASTFSEFARFTKPNLGRHNLVLLIEECLNLFQQYENIHFEWKCPENIPDVYIDAHQVKRIIINLVTNAVHAMEDGGKIIICCKIAQQGCMVKMEIKDNGCGISDDLKPKLFQPNFSTKSHGSGLGLSICKRSIDQMQGSIEIQSEVNVGTTVVVEFPVYKNK